MLTSKPSTKRLATIACGIVLSAILAACGRSNSTPPPAPAQPSPVAQFNTAVTNVVNKGADETNEPDDISGVTAATTETDEPTTL